MSLPVTRHIVVTVLAWVVAASVILYAIAAAPASVWNDFRWVKCLLVAFGAKYFADRLKGKDAWFGGYAGPASGSFGNHANDAITAVLVGYSVHSLLSR